VDSIDNCKPGTDNTDRELSFLDEILDFTDPAVDLTDCTKLTDVRKRHMSNRKDLYQETL
jgi:hypothetical protein